MGMGVLKNYYTGCTQRLKVILLQSLWRWMQGSLSPDAERVMFVHGHRVLDESLYHWHGRDNERPTTKKESSVSVLRR